MLAASRESHSDSRAEAEAGLRASAEAATEKTARARDPGAKAEAVPHAYAETPSGGSLRARLNRAIDEGRSWLRQYLQVDVQRLQEQKQHHVHIYNEETKQRMPLMHCQRKDNPKLCKSDFPRTRWLCEKAMVLCKGLLEEMGMALSGRRSKLCSLHGPMNEEHLNGTHPAVLATLRCNSDVQLPYRLPLCSATHACHKDCLKN